MSDAKQAVLLTGPPGAGKGTQAKYLQQQHGWYAFSVGQILRDTADPDIRARMDAGELLSQEHVVGIVIRTICQHKQSVVIDGFPRRLDQAQAFEEQAPAAEVESYLVIALEVDKHVSWQRVAGRGRNDDMYQAWEHRWQEYYEHTVPAIEHHRQAGNLVCIDGRGSVESVQQRIYTQLGL